MGVYLGLFDSLGMGVCLGRGVYLGVFDSLGMGEYFGCSIP